MTDIDTNRFTPPKAELAEPASFGNEPALAGRGQRLVAVILDAVLMMIVFWTCFFAFGGFGSFAHLDPGVRPNPFGIMGRMFSATLPGYAAAAIIQGWSLHAFGGTLGKKLLGLRIVRTDGSRAGFVRLFFGRGGAAVVPSFIPLLGGLWVLIDSLLIFRDSRQCLHDQIADTNVVIAASLTDASPAATHA